MIKTQIGDVEGTQCYTLEEVSQEVEMLLRDNGVAVIFKCANKHGDVDGSILVTTYPSNRIDQLRSLGEI